MSEKKYVPATPDSSVAKKWVNHLNSQVRKGGDIGVYSGNKNKEIIVPTSVNEESNLARGFFSFYIDGNMLHVYDSLSLKQDLIITKPGISPNRVDGHYCGYGIVGDHLIGVPQGHFDISKIYESATDSLGGFFPNICLVYINFYVDYNLDIRAELKTFFYDIRNSSSLGKTEVARARNFIIGRIGYDGNEIKIVYDINPNPVVMA